MMTEGTKFSISPRRSKNGKLIGIEAKIPSKSAVLIYQVDDRGNLLGPAVSTTNGVKAPQGLVDGVTILRVGGIVKKRLKELQSP